MAAPVKMATPIKMANQATTQVTLSLDSVNTASETSSSETLNSGRPKTSLVWEVFDYDECLDNSVCKVKFQTEVKNKLNVVKPLKEKIQQT